MRVARLKCYVVTRSRCEASEPLYVAVDLNSAEAFDRAKRFVLNYNRTMGTGRTVVRKGQAELSWNPRRTVSVS
jgi:hypothetical protein